MSSTNFASAVQGSLGKVPQVPASPTYDNNESKSCNRGINTGILLTIVFFVSAVFIFLLLWSFKPKWFLLDFNDAKGPVNKVKILGASIILAILITLLTWAIIACQKPRTP